MSEYLSETLTVEKLFSKPFFYRIPAFQRLYSWTELEAEVLLEHLIQAAGDNIDGDSGSGDDDDDSDDGDDGDNHDNSDDDNNFGDSDYPGHFLSSILLIDTSPAPRWLRGGKPSNGSSRIFEVVDGQQRLVTMIILFCVLRDLDTSAAKSVARRLEKIIFQTDDPSLARLTPLDRDAEFFADFVQNPGSCLREMPFIDPSQSQLRILEVRDLIMNRLKEYNNRQRRHLMNAILKACEASVIAARSLDKAHDIFSTLNGTGRPLARSDIIKVEILGQITTNVVPEQDYCLVKWDEARDLLDKGDQFETLFSHIHTLYGPSNPNIISTIRSLVAQKGPRAFIDTILTPLAEAYYATLNPGAGHPGIVGEGDRATEMKTCLISLNWLNSADWVPPAIAFIARHKDKPEEISRFIVGLERFAYFMGILGLGKDKRFVRYAIVTRSIANGELLERDHKVFQFSAANRRHISNNFRSLYSRSTKVCKLILMRLSMDIAGVPEGVNPAKLTVEHVHPRNPADVSSWHQGYRDEKMRQQHVCCLGNLILLPSELNHDAAANDFSAKLKSYFNPKPPKDPKKPLPPPLIAIAARLKGMTQWQAKQIAEKEADLLERVNRIWWLNETSGLK